MNTMYTVTHESIIRLLLEYGASISEIEKNVRGKDDFLSLFKRNSLLQTFRDMKLDYLRMALEYMTRLYVEFYPIGSTVAVQVVFESSTTEERLNSAGK